MVLFSLGYSGFMIGADAWNCGRPWIQHSGGSHLTVPLTSAFTKCSLNS